MEATALARELLEDVPANRLFDLRVLSAQDGDAVVAMVVSPATSNVIGALHSSGLIALADAAGLAALLSAAADAGQAVGVTPLGSDADLTFFAPARGALTARCVLDEAAQDAIERLFHGTADRVAVLTDAQISDESGAAVCTARFRWRITRATSDHSRGVGLETAPV